jgi:hypothetical protein
MTHPIVLAAVALLALNDHWWKAAAPGVVTGKVSDVAGMIFFPIFLQAALEVVAARGGRPWSPSQRTLAGCALATGVVFALVKLCAPANVAYAVTLGVLQWPFRACVGLAQRGSLPALHPVKLVRDATDLTALPMLAVAYWVGAARVRLAHAQSGKDRNLSQQS